MQRSEASYIVKERLWCSEGRKDFQLHRLNDRNCQLVSLQNAFLWKLSFCYLLSSILAFFLVCLIPAPALSQAIDQGKDAKWHVGCELFQMLLEERGLTQMQPLESSFETPKTSVIVLAGDLRRLRVDVWTRIAQFVKRGGNVLIATDQGRVMSGIGEIRPGPVVSLDLRDQYLEFKDCIRIHDIDSLHPAMLGVNEIVSNRTAWLILHSNVTASNVFQWKSVASLPGKCNPATSSGQPVIAIGSTNVENSGMLALVADTSILSNGMIWHGDNATFAIRISELLTEGRRSGLSFIVDGRVMGRYRERMQPSERSTTSNDREEQNIPMMQQMPETDLETKLRMANHVLKSVADSNILNEALANQPRPMNPRLYTFIVLGILASLGALWCLVYLLRRVPTFLARQPVVPHVSAFQMDAGSMNRNSQFGPAAFILAREFCRECSGSSGERDWKNKATGFQFSFAVPNDKVFKEKLEYVRSFEISNLVPRVSEKEFLKLGKTIQELREALRPPKIDGLR
jgi:hypothetical protein